MKIYSVEFFLTTYFTACSRVSIITFEQVNAGWVGSFFGLTLILFDIMKTPDR